MSTVLSLRKIAVLTLSLQLTVISLMYLNNINPDIMPTKILQIFTGILYLLLVPGLLIVSLLRINNLSPTELILYIVGLSIGSLMINGVLITILGPYFNIEKPISLIPMLGSITTMNMILLVTNFYFSKTKKLTRLSLEIHLKDVMNPVVLLFLFIFIFELYGVYLRNAHLDSALLIIFVLILIIVLSLAALIDKFSNYYAYIVFISSLSILYFTSLISPHIIGGDIIGEYAVALNTIKEGLWMYDIPKNTNSIPSVTILVPIFYFISGLSPRWIFKIIYPLIFSIASAGVYVLYLKLTKNKRIAFLSTLFLITSHQYFGTMNTLTRQQIAEFFLIGVANTLILNHISKSNKNILIMLFSIFLALSHYGLAYLFLLYLLSWAILEHIPIIRKLNRSRNLSVSIISIYVAFVILWYSNIASGRIFIKVVRRIKSIWIGIYKDIFEPTVTQPLAIISKTSPPPLYQIYKLLHITLLFFLVIGFFYTIIRFIKNKSKEDFLKLYVSIPSILILAFSATLPFFAVSLQTTRMYHIAQLTSSIFYLYGVLALSRYIYSLKDKIQGTPNRDSYIEPTVRFTLVFLMTFFLFNSGLVYYVTGQKLPTTIALIAYDPDFDYPIYNNQEILSAKWLTNRKSPRLHIYADNYRFILFTIVRGTPGQELGKTLPKSSGYLFLGTYNLKNEEILTKDVIAEGTYNKYHIHIDLRYLTYASQAATYNNDGSRIYIWRCKNG